MIHFNLDMLIDYLSSRDPQMVAKNGFGAGMSYRGYYDCLAFEPVKNTTYGEMLKHAIAAMNTTYEGYKGGQFTMTGDTPTYIAEYGSCGDEISEWRLNNGIPIGWKLVPVEMTDEIGEEIAKHANCCGEIALAIYDAILDAAPTPENGE